MDLLLSLIYDKKPSGSLRIKELSVVEQLDDCHFRWCFTIYGFDYKGRNISTKSIIQIADYYKEYVLDLLTVYPRIYIFSTNADVRNWSQNILGVSNKVQHRSLRVQTFVNSLQYDVDPVSSGYVQFPRYGKSELCKYHDTNYYHSDKSPQKCTFSRLKDMIITKLGKNYDKPTTMIRDDKYSNTREDEREVSNMDIVEGTRDNAEENDQPSEGPDMIVNLDQKESNQHSEDPDMSMNLDETVEIVFE